MTWASDRNLLFGILALQLDFVSREQLITAMNAWAIEKSKPLGEIIVCQQVLSEDRRTLLEALVDEHLKQHENDPEKSLAALSSIGPLRDDLRRIADPEIEATLAHVSVECHRDGLSATRSVGASSSAGLRFRVLRPHAKGGLGEVFVATDEELRREVALKQIQSHHADDPNSRSRFVLEAEITGGLEHPGIVPVYGLGSFGDGRPFYAMRFIRGDSLKDAIEQFHSPESTKLDPGERILQLRKLLARFIDVCNAIEYAHSRGVLHRDLKPGNIMLGKYGETLVVDWGLAKALGQSDAETNAGGGEAPLEPASASGSAATEMGSVLGTPGFMSPEQAGGLWDLLGPASDVYSLGATLYALLTGRPPFELEVDESPAELIARVRRGDFDPPRDVNRSVPPSLQAICLKAMALKRSSRYDSPRALADDIEHWLADEPTVAAPDSWSQRFGRFTRRHSFWTRAMVAAMAMACLLSIIGAILVDKQRHAMAHQLSMAVLERGARECAAGRHDLGVALFFQAYDTAPIGDSLRRTARSMMATWSKPLGVTLETGARRVALSGDGRKVVVVSLGDSGACDVAQLWDVENAKPVGDRFKCAGEIDALAISADGRFICTASGTTWQLWDSTTCKPIGDARSHNATVQALALSPDGQKLFIGSGEIGQVSQAPTGRRLSPPFHRGDKITAGRFTSDGRKILTIAGPVAQLFDADTGSVVGKPLQLESEIKALVITPTDDRLVAVSKNTAEVWDLSQGSRMATSPFQGTRVDDIAFSHDGHLLFAGTDDLYYVGSVRLWASTGWLAPNVELCNGCSRESPVISSDGTTILSANTGYEDVDGNEFQHLCLVDSRSGQQIGQPNDQRVYKGHFANAALSPDGKTVVTAGERKRAKGSVRFWSTSGQNVAGPPITFDDLIVSIAFSPDGRHLLTGSANGIAQLWTADNRKPAGEPIPLKNNPVQTVAFTADGNALLTGSGNWFQCFDIESGKALWRQPVAYGFPGVVAFSPDGKSVFSRGFIETSIKDPVNGKTTATIKVAKRTICAAAFSADGKTLLTGNSEHDAQLWNVSDGKPIGQPMAHSGAVQAVAFSPDGATVLTASANQAQLWDAKTGSPKGVAMKHNGSLTAVAFNPKGNFVLTGSEDKTAQLWDAQTGKPISPPLKHDYVVGAVAFSADGLTFATSSGEQSSYYVAQFWDATTGKPRGKETRLDSDPWTIAFSADSQVALTADVLSDLATGKPVRELPGTSGLALSPDGSLLAQAQAFTNVVQIRDAITGEPRGQSISVGDQVCAAAFSPDGGRVLIASKGAAQLWNIADATPRGQTLHHDGCIHRLAFSHDGSILMTASNDGSARLWEAETGLPLGEPFPYEGEEATIATDDQSLVIVKNTKAHRWRIPQPLPDSPESLRIWCEARTGFQSGKNGTLMRLDGSKTHERQAALRAQGAPWINWRNSTYEN